MNFVGTVKRKPIKVFVLAADSEGNKASKSVEDITEVASTVGGLYKFVAVTCLAMSWLFGQPFRDFNLAFSYEKMSKVDGYCDKKNSFIR